MPSPAQPSRLRPAARAVASLLGLGVLGVVAGVLVALLVAPALAVSSIAANSSIAVFDRLPEYIAPDDLAETTDIFAVDSEGAPVLLASVFEQNREEVGWEAISQFAKDAVIATEDPRFYTHGGVDVASTLRAALGNTVSGAVESGASTISMQYVRNILVQRAEAVEDEAQREAAYEEATRTSADRKIREMRLAIGLEKEFSKDDILLGYLNIAPFGGQTYGIQSAARYYFGVDASALTLAQATSLIAIVNEPNGLRIDEPANIEANQARRDLDVLPAMLRENRITRAQYDEAIATPVDPVITPPSTGCSTANAIGAGFFCDYVGHLIENGALLGTDDQGEANSLERGGYDVYTTLDIDLQAAARSSLDESVPHSSPDLDLGGSLVTVQPGTGRVLAMAQNKEFNADPEAATPENTAVNYGTNVDEGGSTGFQVGSTYKAFALAEWLEQGHSLNDRVDGDPRTYDLSAFEDSCLGSGTGTYTPRNDGGSRPGTISVLAATAASVNNAYLDMALELDQCAIRQTAEAFGVTRADGRQLTSYVSDVLGTNEIAPITMAAAFAAIANEGVYCPPVAIDRIIDSDGAELPVPQSECRRAVTAPIAATMAYALTSVVTGGTAMPSNPQNGIPHFGKTGTTDSGKDTWFVGSTTELTTAVWVGNVTGDVSVSDASIDGQTGGYLRHTVWRTYMTEADAKYGGDDFPEPDPRLLRAPPAPTPGSTPAPTPAAPAAPPATPAAPPSTPLDPLAEPQTEAASPAAQ
jgi:membrane peptidoglycan carboxypeptidase